MFRGAAIGFVVSMLLTAVATLMSTGAVHAQQGPQHVFSGYVSNHRQPLNDGFVKVTIGPGFGLQPAVQEVAYEAIRQGRYKIAVEDPTRGNHWAKTNPGSPVMLKFWVIHQGREYQWQKTVRLEPGRVAELNFDIEGWLWHQAQPRQVGNQPQQRDGNQPGGSGGMNANQQARFEMERERMEREEEMRREEDQERRQMERDRMEREEERQRDREDRDAEMRQDEQQSRRGMEEDMRREQMEMERERMERESEMREKEGEERREMERERMERESEMREKQMESEAEMRREQMELDRQRVGRGQPGVRPVGGERPQSGPGRGLFSNSKAGEPASGIDNIMDPGMLTIIGIVLTVLTTGMTLFKGD